MKRVFGGAWEARGDLHLYLGNRHFGHSAPSPPPSSGLAIRRREGQPAEIVGRVLLFGNVWRRAGKGRWENKTRRRSAKLDGDRPGSPLGKKPALLSAACRAGSGRRGKTGTRARPSWWWGAIRGQRSPPEQKPPRSLCCAPAVPPRPAPPRPCPLPALSAPPGRSRGRRGGGGRGWTGRDGLAGRYKDSHRAAAAKKGARWVGSGCPAVCAAARR